MLTYESLIGHAESKGMPQTKLRGVLREYLHVLILKELYRLDSGKKLYFTGGTYLRLAHGLKRFSEDLDFNSNTMPRGEFESLLLKVKNELKRTGLEAHVKFSHWENMYVAKLAFADIEKAYNIVSGYSKKEGIIIKVESNNLRHKIKKETLVVSGFGELYPCVCTDKGILFADKIDALTKKNRARHIYDIMFMLSNQFPIDRGFLKILGIRQDPLKAISDRIKGMSKGELKKQSEALRPFLFDEKEGDLVANAHVIIPQLLEKYNGAHPVPL